ncbi:MAG: hypothetical protein H8D26_00785 [Methanomicrobia archaeon]|nr:hypothetical protein [Methanomicrobia archaeon]
MRTPPLSRRCSPILTPIGIIALARLLAIVAVSEIIKRRKYKWEFIASDLCYNSSIHPSELHRM